MQGFWKQAMDRYGSEEAYNRELISSFGRADGIEILVVVDRLLMGFDELRNTVLYIDKPLKEHTLLQAIARVNRLADGKDFGYIVDYRGVLGELNEAMNQYDALASYDAEDIAGAFTDVQEQIRLLPQRHSELWAIFAPVSNRGDRETVERFLEPEDRRQQFYEALAAYAGALRVAMSSVQFFSEVSEAQIERYRSDLKYFHDLRQAIKLRYAETVDYRDYEEKVRKLMDQHVRATGTTVITQLVNIFDVEKFDAEVKRLGTPAARADTVLNQIKRTVSERLDEDPAFYRKFAELVEETIQAYRQGRIGQLEYLRLAEANLQQMRAGKDSAVPHHLLQYRDAPAYYGVVRETLATYGLDESAIAGIAIEQEAAIEARKIRDWENNRDVQMEMKASLDDIFYAVEERSGLLINADQLDVMIDQVIEVEGAQRQAGCVMPGSSHLLHYGETEIPYTLTYARRKTVAIHVHPDQSVLVKAPEGSNFAAVEDFVRRRAAWIVRKRAEFARLPAARPPKRFISGESFAHLGRQYRLKVLESERPWVKLSRGYLEVTTPNRADTAVVQRQVEEWQRRQARRVFYERVLALLPRFTPLALPEPELVIKPLKTRWGSCTHDGRIILNLLLIRMPKAQIDYVIAHELCHLVEHNHGKGFYALLARVLPDWEVRRRRLNEAERG